MTDFKQSYLVFLVLVAALVLAAPVSAATTSLTITKLASDGTTVLDTRTVDYTWMMNNLDVYGDGVTHYYHQGPVFVDDPDPAVEEMLRWNPDEDANVEEKDNGAVKGTNLKDLCDLVGGMNAGETVSLRASDGFFKIFAYTNVYEYTARQGPMVITWYADFDTTDSIPGVYPDTGYTDGMKLVFYADDSVNPFGIHVMGNWDWHESAAPEYWYYYVSGSEQYPTTTGLSVKYIADVIIYSDDPAPSTEVLYNGPVTLTPDEKFDVTAYNSAVIYNISETTPLGALQATGLTYEVTDKNYATSGALLLDNVDSYPRDKTNGIYWYAYVNDVYKDGYNNPAGGLNLIELADGDRVEFYYAAGIADPTDLTTVKAAATASVKTVADIPPPYDLLFDGTVTLTPDEKFDVTAYNSAVIYNVSETTPLGALQATGLTYEVTDKNYATSGALLLDNVDSYPRDKTNGIYWYAYVNDVYKDGYNNPAGGLNLIELADGDRVEFYYAAGIADPTDLTAVKAATTAAVKTVASTGTTPTDWSIVLDGAKTMTVSKAYFEAGLAHAHQEYWTDADGNVWGGMPLWLLAGLVDDDPDDGAYHDNFNDDLAARNYEVKVISTDGWSAVFDSAEMARSSDYLVANTFNGDPLPTLTEGGKISWPLHLVGAGITKEDGSLGGRSIGSIARIELNNLPEPVEGWTLSMLGEVGDTITQQEFEDGLACTMSGHLVEYTDIDGNTWSGVPLWVLLGAIDDIELSDHWTFNDEVAATGYTVKITAADGFSKTYSGTTIARNNSYIIANEMNGEPLDSAFPLRLVGSGVTKSDGTLGGSAIGQIVRIEILELQTPAPAEGSYNLALNGKITDVLSQAEIEQGLACPQSGHLVTWTQQIKDTDGNVIETHEWSGIPLWFLAGWVDDRQPHDFNAVQATAGYKITVVAGDGYAKDFQSADVAWSSDYIIATMKDGAPLPDGKWPLQLVGDPLTRADGTLGGMSVAQVAEIKLTEFGVPVEIPKLRIVKYGPDQQTVTGEVYIDYTEMQQQFEVIGDGVTQYKYQGVTMDPTDIWGVADETKGGFKISNAIKGTKVYDLVELVGGMGEGTDIVFVASDGYKTILPYTSIYTTPEVQDRQGDAILAWFADGKYVPGYADGMRLFFTPEDKIYGQWDMHETMPAGYWHYYYQSYLSPSPYAPGILYPSAAGTSAKYVTEIRVYSTPESDWNLYLDGRRIGGIDYTVNKAYFEAALACQFGANHDASYTDTSGNVWTGMPLWFLQGFVDDADQHSNTAYNQTLAEQGYDIVVMASDGYSKTFNSADTVRSGGYIVANTLNGYHIPESDTSWPLRLVGDNVTKKDNVKKVSEIILNFRPVIDSVTVPTDPVRAGSDAGVIAYFTDPYDTHPIALIDWGDGQTSDGVVDETARTITGSHVYAENGFYTIIVTLVDSAGVTVEKPADATIVVYDPDCGEATGSGTITFGAGEFTLVPDAAGKASFSLLGKYDHKGEPSGKVKLVLTTAKSSFESAYVDYIVILDQTAYIHGMGSIDKGSTDYEFLLVATDGGKQGADTYRLQVWDLNRDTVFDNAPEAGDKLNADASPLSGGSVVIK
jgi:hypothetical protein